MKTPKAPTAITGESMLVGLNLRTKTHVCLTLEQATYLAKSILAMVDLAVADIEETILLPEDNEGSLGGLIPDKSRDETFCGIEIETASLGDTVLVNLLHYPRQPLT